jgi:1,4-dihydroxy-2-naphthoate octaprenyltransferase
MKDQSIIHDERTVTVENSSYRWAYLLLSFGLLAIVAYRGFVRQESNWDLLALVVLSGFVTTLYQGVHKTISRR